MRIATWNVNSLRVRLEQVLDWLRIARPDALALQETKLPDALFPREAIESAGYHVAFSGQRTYNGVAILSQRPIEAVVTDIPGLDDPQRRVLAATVGELRLINLYVPNGAAVGTDKYAYKLDWLSKVGGYLQTQLARHPLLAVMGDFNIAPEDRDVHDPELWFEKILCSTPERRAFKILLEGGLVDCFRLFEQEAGAYSWWDYRTRAFGRNHGLRIDVILASPLLSRRCTVCRIDAEPRRHARPSDHAPVTAEFELGEFDLG